MSAARLRRNPVVREESIDDALFLIDEAGDAIYHLDALGAALWRLLEAEPALDELAGLFAEAFPEVDPMTLANDVVRAVETLCRSGLAVAARPAQGR